MTAAPKLLWEGAENDPVVVVRSSFWGYNSIGLFAGDRACVIDPGIYPEDIELLNGRVTEPRGRRAPAGRARAGRRTVTDVVITHSHHDHIRGWMAFPGARVILPRVAADKTPSARDRILAAKSVIDQKLEIDDPKFRYPDADVVFDDTYTFDLHGLEIELRFLPGHSNCTSVVWLPSLRTLCTADYLVSPGLPYCRWEARAFESALETIEGWVRDEGVQRILPSHYAPLLGKPMILAALSSEREYFQVLRQLVRTARAQGLDDEACVLRAASAMDARRPQSAGPRARQDLDNARRVLVEESAPEPG